MVDRATYRCDRIFYGALSEEPTACWYTIEAHKSLAVNKERLYRFVKMFEAFAKDGVPQGKVIHVFLDESVALPCLRAPVTEGGS